MVGNNDNNKNNNTKITEITNRINKSHPPKKKKINLPQSPLERKRKKKTLCPVVWVVFSRSYNAFGKTRTAEQRVKLNLESDEEKTQEQKEKEEEEEEEQEEDWKK